MLTSKIVKQICPLNAYPLCHCEEHSDVATSMKLNTRRRTAVAMTTRLPRYARNDTGGTHQAGHVARTPLICHCEEHSDVAISMRLNTRRPPAVATTTRLPRYARNDTGGTHEAGHVARTPLICHCEEHSDVAISMRLNTRRRTAVAMTTRLPRYARNDTGGTHEDLP